MIFKFEDYINLEIIDLNPEKYELQKIQPIKASELLEKLNKTVVNQDYAKKMLSTIGALYLNHINFKSDFKQSFTFFLSGSTGSGKTHTIKEFAKVLNVPYVTAAADSFTATGYVGRSFTSVLEELKEKNINLGNNEDAIEGIIFIDEMDKICKASGGRENDGFKTSTIQQAMLTYLEPGVYTIEAESTKSPLGKGLFKVDTSKIIWVFGGSFTHIVTSLNKPSKGFIAKQKIVDKKNIDPNILTEHGMIRELAGRISHVILLEDLTDDDFYAILKKVDNSLVSQYQSLAKASGLDLKITDKELKEIIKEARKLKTGARALKGTFERYYLNKLYQ